MSVNSRVVEQGVPLSQSFIWKLQAKFYESLGIDAWLSGVIPSKITTNAFIARTFARAIVAWAADQQAREISIVELGAGHGRFGFLCAKALREMTAAGLLPNCRWKYVMTDVAERNIGFWQQHEALKPLVEEGLMDYARFEGGADDSITLRESGDVISAAHPTGHLVVIGNYFFDSLPIDAWQVEDGQLRFCTPVLSLKPDATCDDCDNSEILEQLSLAWHRTDIDAPNYERSDLNELVEHFRESVLNGVFTIPVSGVETLTALESWSQHGSLLLTADKGYTRETDLIDRPLPTMVQHGCFSFSVNFCAMAEWYRLRGGSAWLPTTRDGSLEMACFASRGGQNSMPRLHGFFQEGPASFSPGDFHQVTRRVAKTTPDLHACLSLIRLSCHEPQVLHHLRRAIRNGLDDATSDDRQALRELLPRVAANYFHLDNCDVPFAIGLIYQHLGDYTLAVPCYTESLRLFGGEFTTLKNLATCLRRVGSLEDTLECIERALAIDPADEDLLRMQEQLEAQASIL